MKKFVILEGMGGGASNKKNECDLQIEDYKEQIVSWLSGSTVHQCSFAMSGNNFTYS